MKINFNYSKENQSLKFRQSRNCHQEKSDRIRRDEVSAFKISFSSKKLTKERFLNEKNF